MATASAGDPSVQMRRVMTRDRDGFLRDLAALAAALGVPVVPLAPPPEPWELPWTTGLPDHQQVIPDGRPFRLLDLKLANRSDRPTTVSLGRAGTAALRWALRARETTVLRLPVPVQLPTGPLDAWTDGGVVDVHLVIERTRR